LNPKVIGLILISGLFLFGFFGASDNVELLIMIGAWLSQGSPFMGFVVIFTFIWTFVWFIWAFVPWYRLWRKKF